jgi:hypothetical protein
VIIRKYRCLLVVACLLGSIVGCSGNSPFDYVPVSGKLTFEDDTLVPAAGIVLQFVAQNPPQVQGVYPRPASATLNAQGEFDCATSYKYGDGLIPGKHKVAIFYAVDAQGNPLVPKPYTHASTTPLVVDTANLPLHIKVPRATGGKGRKRSGK